MQEMKYFNEGNDCDICKNQLMTGRDGTVEDCRRRQNGLSCRFEERDIRTCPVCEHEVDREDMYFTTEYIEQLRINGLSCGEIIIDTIPRGATVIIDGETGFATMDGENKFKDVSLMEFPYLTTGQEKEHHLIFSDNNALVTLQYKPMWL